MENNSRDDNDEPSLSTSLDCEMYTPIQWGLLLYSILVLFIYMCSQKRVKWQPKILYGHFGLPIPINFINETKDRWAYAAVFGILSGTFVQLIFDGSFVSSGGYGDSILRGFILFLIMLLIPLLFFALIGSIHANIQVLSHFIGFIYTVTSFLQQVLVCLRCLEAASDVSPRFYQNAQYIRIFGTTLPIVLCTVVAALFFVIRGIQGFISIIINKPLYQQNISHHFAYVKALLGKESDVNEFPEVNSKLKMILFCVERYIYKRDPYFKYPVRLMCVASVVIIGLLVLTVQLLNFFATAVRFAEDSIDDDSTGIDVVIVIANIFAVIIPITAYIIVILSFISSLTKYRDHCKRVWKGDYSFMPHKKNTPAETLIGMAIWAWVFYITIMLLILVSFIVVILLMVFVEEVREWIIRRVIIISSTFIFGLLFTFLQLLITRFVFAKGKGTIANNSRLFHLYAYFFLFYNALIGLFRALRRVFTSAVVSLFFLPRLDRSLLIKGLERYDKGYIAYLSAVRVDAAYNNPVMNVFVYLLIETKKAKKKCGTLGRFITKNYYQPIQINSIDITTSQDEFQLKFATTNNGRFRKLWHLAYTLVRNPNLKELRRRDKRESKTTDRHTQQFLSPVASYSIFDIVNEEKNKEFS